MDGTVRRAGCEQYDNKKNNNDEEEDEEATVLSALTERGAMTRRIPTGATIDFVQARFFSFSFDVVVRGGVTAQRSFLGVIVRFGASGTGFVFFLFF